MFNLLSKLFKRRNPNEEPIIALAHEMEYKGHLKKHKNHVDRVMYKVGLTKKRGVVNCKIIGKEKMLTYAYWAEPEDTILGEKITIGFRPDNNYPKCKLRLILEAGKYLNINLTSEQDHTNWSISKILEHELSDLEHKLKRELKKLKESELHRLKAA